MGAEFSAAAGAIASAIAVIVVSLRRRKDVDVVELLDRIADLTKRVNHLEGEVVTVRKDALREAADNYILRRTLAEHGIPDPTGV